MIELGCCAFNFQGLALQDALRLTRQIGFRNVDVGASGPQAQINQEAAATRPARVGGELRTLIKRNGLTPVELFCCAVHVNGEPVDPNHPDARLRQQMLQRFRGLCQCAAEAGFQSIMGLPGRRQAELNPRAAWKASAETLAEMAVLAERYGLAFNVEPSGDSILRTPEAALRMAQEVPRLGYTLDYAHFVGQSIPAREVFPLHAHTRHMHAKPARPGVAKCLVHEAEVDWEGILQDLHGRGWSGVISIECIYDVRAPTLTRHPAVQSALLAHQLERILDPLYASAAGDGREARFDEDTR
jgi:sugar phosphate isomerase/epimerase